MRKALAGYFISILAFAPFLASAQDATSTAAIQQSIDAKNAQIQALQATVSQYQDQVDQIEGQAKTLKGTLNLIGTTQKQLQKNIALTGTQAQKAQLTIQQNQQQIGTLGRGISKNTEAIGETLRLMNIDDKRSLLELLASDASVSSFVEDVDQIMSVQSSLQGNVTGMLASKSELQNAQGSLASRKTELVALTSQLKDQKQIVDSQAADKQALLAQTNNKESAYQQLLDTTQKQIDALTAETYQYESSLKFSLNAGSLPPEGSAPLAWPLASVLITQKFGKTVDSRRLYAVGTHSGVDFRAAVGTPVYAVADGTVEGTGNTDLTCPKASFGKWVFIRHNDGLATAYGHLSLIKATSGEAVKQGELIGYSGSTGHVTGPHLHLTVYAANGIDGQEGARIDSRPSAACKGKTYTMPLAPTNAYLDPLLYLPHATASMYKDGGASSSE